MHPYEPDLRARFADRPLAGEEPAAEFRMERRWLPGSDGELTGRIAYTNVPHHVVDLASRGFDWGNAGPGAHDLALTILETALRRTGHRGPRSTRLEGACFLLALLLRGQFVAAFLAALPEEGGTLSAAEVEDWIAAERERLDPAQHALLAPRYAWEGGDDGEHWSAGELAEIVGEPLREHADGLYTADGRRIARRLEPHPLDTADWEPVPL
jgi:hypothetical protein